MLPNIIMNLYIFEGVKQYQEVFLTATETVPVTDVRLPTHAIPEKYVIHLTPFIIPDNFTIEGCGIFSDSEQGRIQHGCSGCICTR